MGSTALHVCKRCGIKHGGRFDICKDCRGVDPHFETRQLKPSWRSQQAGSPGKATAYVSKGTVSGNESYESVSGG